MGDLTFEDIRNLTYLESKDSRVIEILYLGLALQYRVAFVGHY